MQQQYQSEPTRPVRSELQIDVRESMGPSWVSQTQDVWDRYKKAGNGDSATNASRKVVARFGPAIQEPSDVLVPLLQELCRQPQSSMPLAVRTVMAKMLDGRTSFSPVALEKDPKQADDLATVINQTKIHLVGDPSRPTETLFPEATSAAAKSAVSAADRYMTRFRERSARAQAHISDGAAKVTALPDIAVEWCRTLADFTGREIGSSGSQALASVRKCLESETGVLPVSNDRKALSVLRATADYLENKMNSRVLNNSSAVHMCAQAYRQDSPRLPQPR